MARAGKTERVVEVPWLISHIGEPRNVLDVGGVDSSYIRELISRASGKVTAIDTRHPDGISGLAIDFKICNAANMPHAWEQNFDLVTCVSVLDHIGLDAYGNRSEIGLLERAVSEIARVTTIGGRLLMTVPFGRDCTTDHPGGGQRVFDRESLRELFAGQWEVISESYWRMIIGDIDRYELPDDYLSCTLQEAIGAEYQTYRAGAVVAMELKRVK